MAFMDHLAPPKKGPETAGSIPSTPPQLYSLRLGKIRGDLNRSATAMVVDALSRSGLPFFEIRSLNSARSMLSSFEPGGFSLHRNRRIQNQLWWNQRNLISERSPNDTYKDPYIQEDKQWRSKVKK